MENPKTGERLNEKNEIDRAVERGADAARGKKDSWDQCEWGRETICGFQGCGFVVLPIIDFSLHGQTPEAPVKDLFLMTKFYGSTAEIESHFERLRAFHVGKPCGLLALILDEQEKNYNNPQDNVPTPAEAESRKAAEDPVYITDPEHQKVTE